MNMLVKFFCGILVYFVVYWCLLWSSGRSWSFQTLNLEVFKRTREIICPFITMCADSVAMYASIDQFLCLKWSEIYNYYEKCV